MEDPLNSWNRMSPLHKGLELGRYEKNRIDRISPQPIKADNNGTGTQPQSSSSTFDFGGSSNSATSSSTPSSYSGSSDGGLVDGMGLAIGVGIVVAGAGAMMFASNIEKIVSTVAPVAIGGGIGIGLMYGTFRGLNHIWDDAVKAGLVTAGIYGTLAAGAGGVMLHNADQARLLKEFPQISIMANNKGFLDYSIYTGLGFFSGASAQSCSVDNCERVYETEMRIADCVKAKIIDHEAGEFPVVEITPLYTNGQRNSTPLDPLCNRESSIDYRGNVLSCTTQEAFYCNVEDNTRLLSLELNEAIASNPERLSFRPVALNENVYGIGAILRKHYNGVEIVEVYHGGSAHRSGLKSGDIIWKINGNSIKETPLEEIISIIGATDRDSLYMEGRRDVEGGGLSQKIIAIPDKEFFFHNEEHFLANAPWPRKAVVPETPQYFIPTDEIKFGKDPTKQAPQLAKLDEADCLILSGEKPEVSGEFLKVTAIGENDITVTGYVPWKNLKVAPTTAEACTVDFR